MFYVILARNCGLACCGENEMPAVISDRVVGCEGHVTMLSTEVSLSRAHCICTPRGFSVSCLPAASVGLVMLPKLQVINPNADDEDFQPPKKRSCKMRRYFPSMSQARKLLAMAKAMFARTRQLVTIGPEERFKCCYATGMSMTDIRRRCQKVFWRHKIRHFLKDGLYSFCSK